MRIGGLIATKSAGAGVAVISGPAVGVGCPEQGMVNVSDDVAPLPESAVTVYVPFVSPLNVQVKVKLPVCWLACNTI